MWSLVIQILLFFVQIQYSFQRIEQSLRTKVELCEIKYDLILTEVLKINKNIDNIWETLNDGQVEHASTPGIIAKETSDKDGTSSNQSSATLPRNLSNKLNKIEKAIRDEKHVTRKDTLRRDQITQHAEQDKLRGDQAKLRSDQNTLYNKITENASNVTHTLMAIKVTLNREMNQMRNENNKLNEALVITKSQTDTLANKLNGINEMYDSLKDGIDYYNRVLSLKQNGWVQHDNSLYKAFKNKMTWSDAMDKCKSESNGVGFLAEIQNMNEVNVVTGLVDSHRHFWLGGCDIYTEGSWKWCGSGSSIVFTNWREGEPNNIGSEGGDENCLHGYTSLEDKFLGEWNDSSCSTKLPFVCEKAV